MKKPDLYCCFIGYLVGDSLCQIPMLVEYSKNYHIKLIVGTYSRYVFDWIVTDTDIDTEIVAMLGDGPGTPFNCEQGMIAIHKATDYISKRMKIELPKDGITYDNLLNNEMLPSINHGGGYQNKLNYSLPNIKSFDVCEKNYICVQPYTEHTWKNCNNFFINYPFQIEAHSIGKQNEPSAIHAIDKRGIPFNEVMKEILQSKFICGVASFSSVVAFLWHKKQVYCTDIECYRKGQMSINPNCYAYSDTQLSQVEEKINELSK